jgi:hypothetical protein
VLDFGWCDEYNDDKLVLPIAVGLIYPCYNDTSMRRSTMQQSRPSLPARQHSPHPTKVVKDGTYIFQAFRIACWFTSLSVKTDLNLALVARH